MDKMLELFEKSLADYHKSIGKKDNLVGSGEIVAQEFKKLRDANVTLGQLLADFYAQERQEQRKVVTLTASENFERQLRNQALSYNEAAKLKNGPTP